MKKNKTISIITHNGIFHADDVFAVATLRILLEKKVFKNIEKGGITKTIVSSDTNIKIIRTRDEEIINTGDYVVDVGYQYNANKERFDHHQKGGAGKRENSIPYASFGLVWKKYGKKITGSEKVAEAIDKVLIAYIDATDNGIVFTKSIFEGYEPYTVFNVISAMNILAKNDPVDSDKVFLKAVEVAQEILQCEIQKRKKKVNDQKNFEKIYAKQISKGEDPRVIVLPTHISFSAKHFLEPLFVVYKRSDGGWAAEGIDTESTKDPFERRAYFPKSWAGKTDGEIVKESGVVDAVFCHNGTHFIAAKSKKGALDMVKIALDSGPQKPR